MMRIYKPTVFFILLLIAAFLPSFAQGQTDYSGTYYIASNGYSSTNTTNNYYLCPTENWYYYQATSPYYQNSVDNGMPFLTTYKCKNGSYQTSNAAWIIQKHPSQNYYYIKHASTGKYLTFNVAMGNSSNAGRMRVHLEASPADDDDALFEIVWVSSKNCYDIKTKKSSADNANRKFMNVTDGNKEYLTANGKTDGPNGMSVGGIIGLWTSGSASDNNSRWFLEPVSTDNPTITNNFDGTFTITAETGATIYYTTDGTNPTTSSPNSGTTTVTVHQT